MKDEKIFLNHILENIKNADEFSLGLSKKDFEENKLKQMAIVRCIEVIGEATKNLPIGFANKYSEVKWSEIAGMRDKLIHHYFGVDLDKVWEVIKKDLPTLKKEVEKILKDLK